ncbi:TetR/AcrR family transcriptional regulator [Glycomyces tarimensis]
MTDQAGLRERKKAATKAALSAATLHLALQKGGIDAVSPDDIAAEAGVSTRTFHNYFSNKEAALLHDFDQRAQRFTEELRERVRSQGVWDALRDAAISLETDKDCDVRMLQCREELLKSSPSLISHQAGQFVELFTELGDIVAEATGTEPGDMYPRLVLGAALVAIKVANEHWITHPEEETLPEAITQAFATLESGIARPPTTSQ